MSETAISLCIIATSWTLSTLMVGHSLGVWRTDVGNGEPAFVANIMRNCAIRTALTGIIVHGVLLVWVLR